MVGAQFLYCRERECSYCGFKSALNVIIRKLEIESEAFLAESSLSQMLPGNDASSSVQSNKIHIKRVNYL